MNVFVDATVDTDVDLGPRGRGRRRRGGRALAGLTVPGEIALQRESTRAMFADEGFLAGVSPHVLDEGTLLVQDQLADCAGKWGLFPFLWRNLSWRQRTKREFVTWSGGDELGRLEPRKHQMRRNGVHLRARLLRQGVDGRLHDGRRRRGLKGVEARRRQRVDR